MRKVVMSIFFLMIFQNTKGFCNIPEEKNIYTTTGNLFQTDNEVNDAPTKYQFSICAVFHNEAYHLKEWLEHHRKIGIEHIYLYNIGSHDPYFFILHPYINESYVTLVNWPGQLEEEETITSMRISAYENAIHVLAKSESKWLLFLDIDEFLNCPNGNINEILTQLDSCSGIVVKSSIVDLKNSNMDKKTSKSEDDLRSIESPVSEKEMVKMIFKADQCRGFSWPPYQCKLKEQDAVVYADKNEIHVKKHINRMSKQQMIKDCLRTKKQSELSIAFETNAAYLAELEKNYPGDSLDLPMYHCMPTFLKKLKLKYQNN